ncbi:hypothetical protein [Neorhizobium sp. DT-125]|uniref:hypothetical protein n=1 Tax=Neorhizobium sp. DT-125 TaxID=3396163 RepID=UPI003F1B90EC
MRHWRRPYYSLLGPLMVWTAFVIIMAILGGGTIAAAGELSPLTDALLRTVALFCVIVLAPLAALAEIAPPFVTRAEVNWRNRNSEQLFVGDVGWEDVPFLPPVLNRIRSTIGKRRDEPEREGETSPQAKPSIA